MEAFETFEVDGLTVGFVTDDEPSSPADWDTLGTLYKFADGELRNYTIGVDADSTAAEAYDRGGCALLVRYLRMTGVYAVPIQFADYGSGGARMYALDLDDDGRADGYVATDAARVAELASVEQSADPAWIYNALRGEVQEWDAYFEGRVIGYVVTDENGDTVDSCFGFYPDENGDGFDYVRAEARSIAETYAETERVERARAAAMDVATVTR